MPIFSSKEQPVPRRKSKPKPNPWDRDADFTALKSAISSGRMKPLEQVWIYVDNAAMQKKMGLKFPARTATDSMRRFIRSLGLESDYYVRKDETNTPGQTMVVVTYAPPMAGMPKKLTSRVAQVYRRNQQAVSQRDALRYVMS
jgi:hypothetical protein